MGAIKVSLCGESNTGKTTLCKLLENRPQKELDQRRPTIGVEVNVANLESGEKVTLWDLAGQRRFQIMWDEFMRGSSVTMVVTDSTPKNVMLTKDIIERHLNKTASKVIAIANKQDLEDRMSPEEIQVALGVPTYGMVATDTKNRQYLEKILKNHIS